jgi:hypothetical protein
VSDLLIKRQDAIDAILSLTNCDTVEGLRAYVIEHDLGSWWSGGVLSSIGKVERLPSAEPKTPSNGSITCVKSEKMHVRTTDDCIRRQDACEAVKNEMESWLEGDRCDYRNVVDAIMDLPSAEKAQLSEEDATKDATSGLIRRQDAIDAVKFGITYAKAINKSTGEVKELFKEGNKALNEAVERLKELPSAEPETASNGSITCVKSEKMHVRTTDGLISRQDVLHELDGCDYELKDWQRWKLKTMVRDIPSAEPEIIQCKDCKYWISDGCKEVGCMEDDFCSYAERGEEE